MYIYILKNFSHMCKFKCKTFYFAERITFTRETTKSQRKTLNEEKTFVLPFYASTLSLSLLFCFRFTIIFPHFPSLAQLFSVFSWKMIFQFIWDTHTSNVNMWENSHSIILVTAWHFFMHALKFLTRRRKILI